jgi:NAD(P)-dependent dehydrogenase (short-subunit alcohol dehydrogenase family)
LGQALAVRFAERGTSCALLDLDASGMAKTARHVRAYGVPCCEIRADLTDREVVVEAIKRTVTELGRLDVLVNNAGTASVQAFLEITAPEWDKVFAVNVSGTLAMMQAAARHMKDHGGGRIVNIT